jgi:hypothetical protein
MKALVSLGFTEESAIEALGLDALEWVKPVPLPVPVVDTTGLSVTVADTSRSDMAQTQQTVAKSYKSAAETSRDNVTDPATVRARARLQAFFTDQKQRVIHNLRQSLPASKADRMKADPTWWDAEYEDAELTQVLRELYTGVGRGALQTISDTLGRAIVKGAVNSVIADLLEVGGRRIKGINDVTLQAITIELAEGTRRGYSIPQLIDGVPDEGYRGIANLTGFDDARAETIARTESMLSYNRATVDGYGEFGITTLLAYDGDQDEACAERNGQEFSIAEAQDIEDHPNGTLVWSPVVDKSYHEPDTSVWLDAIKALAERPVPNVYITPANAPDIVVPITVGDGTDPSHVYVSNASTASFTEAIHELTELMRTPKRQSIIRDAAGHIIGVESV